MSKDIPLVVRTTGCMIFEVDRKSLGAKRPSVYDFWCFSDPDPSVEYMEFHEWVLAKSEMEKNTASGARRNLTRREPTY